MDPKSARELIEQACRELDRAPERQALLQRAQAAMRPLGLGLALGLAVAASSGCGDDDKPAPGPDSAYGVPDSVLVLDGGPQPLYAVPQDGGAADLPPNNTLYAVPMDAGASDLPPNGSLYAVPMDSSAK